MTLQHLLTLAVACSLSTSGFASQSAWIAPELLALAAGDTAPVLIFLEEQADLSAASLLPTKTLKGRFVFESLREVAARAQGPLLTILQGSSAEHRAFFISNLIWAEVTPTLLRQLAAVEGIERIVPSPQGSIERPVERVDAVAAGKKAGVEWNLSMIRADDVWAEGYTGQGAMVGGIDTGYIWQHPAITRQWSLCSRT